MVRSPLSLIASTIALVALPLVAAHAQKPDVKAYGGPLYVGTDFKGGHYEPPVYGPRDRRSQSAQSTAAAQGKKPVRAARAYPKGQPVTAVAAQNPVTDAKDVEAANASSLGAGSPVAPEAVTAETSPTITSPMVSTAAADAAASPEPTVKTDGAFAPTAAKADEPTPAASPSAAAVEPTTSTPVVSTTPAASTATTATTALIETSSLRQNPAAVAAAEPFAAGTDKADELCSRYMPTIGKTISVVCR